MRTNLSSDRVFPRVAAVAVTVVAVLLVGVSAALAHVTMRTDNPAPSAFAKYTLRVPNESDSAATTSVEVQFPDGFEPGLVRPVPGWDISISAGVMTVEGGRIEPGEFAEFEFTARNPETATTLTFPAIQTYDDGEEARWVGEPDANEPAPRVELVASQGDQQEATDAETTAAAEPAAAVTDDEYSDTDVWSIAAVVVSLVAAAMSGAALVTSRRR